MSDAESERQREEGPPVRVKTRVVRRGDAGRLTTDPLRGGLRDAERRFLSLQSSAAGGVSPEAPSEYLAILADLKVIGERLHDMSGRRDISYLTDRRLTVLNHYCLWLTRRVSAEFLLILQIQLEQELKRGIGPQAYQMYLRLEDVADAAREVEMLDDRDLMARLREGALLREILEQVLPGDASAWAPRGGGTTESSGEGGPSG